MKKRSLVASISTTLSCVVGAAFVGGNEIVRYFGGSIIAAVFFCALLLCSLLIVVTFCQRKGVTSIVELSKKLYKRESIAFLWVVSLCLFCVVIALYSTTSTCLSTLLNLHTNLPIFSVATAIICFFVAKIGKRAVEKIATVMLPVSVAFLVAAHLHGSCQVDVNLVASWGGSITYCGYNVVPMLGVIAGGKQNKGTIAVAVALLALLCCMQVATTTSQAGLLPTLAAVADSKLLFAWGVTSVYLSGLTSILLCSMPVWEFLEQIVCDRVVVVASTTILAAALSNFGFDKIASICYPIIALVGVISLIAMMFDSAKSKLIGERARLSPAPSRKKIKKKKIKK